MAIEIISFLGCIMSVVVFMVFIKKERETVLRESQVKRVLRKSLGKEKSYES
jgi:hypothetical protein